ncbi:MAG: hypothetical protein GX577_08325 [Leptolinea sp.]|nr:hypothetical protein [Leptolinea sp.]
MAFSLNSTIGEIMDNPKARIVIDKHIPGASGNPMLGMVKGWTLNTIISMPQANSAGLTRQKAEMLLAELNKQIE